MLVSALLDISLFFFLLLLFLSFVFEGSVYGGLQLWSSPVVVSKLLTYLNSP